jgi:hypothetical protein
MALWRERLFGFLFPVEADGWIAYLRLGLGLQVMAYALASARDWNYFFLGTRGLVSRNFAEALVAADSRLTPTLGWLVGTANHIGLAEASVLSLVWFCLLAAGMCLLVGFLCRPAAIAAWFLHLAAVKSGNLLSYGMDNFTTIGLFYLMLSPLPYRFALDAVLWPSRSRHPQLSGFWRRALQMHLCLIYFFGGLTKALGAGWWNGTNFWRALIRPPLNIIPVEVLVKWSWCFAAVGISIWLLEISYPFLIWNKRTRLPWLIAILVMHGLIGLLMGMYLFASVMIVLNLAAFGPGHAWREKGSTAAPAEEAIVDLARG